MAKTKHRSSASQRRDEVRSQRQQRMSSGSGKQSQSRNNRRARNTRKSLPWGLIVGVLLVLVAVIGVFIYISQQSSSTSGKSSTPTPTTASVLDAVNNVSPSIFAAVGTGGQQNIMVSSKKAGSTPPPLVGPSGKPEFFYAGAEYCPFCAAERWGAVVALGRFGKFTHLNETTSSPDDVYPSTPTFTFYQSAYSSQYIDFVSVETEGQKQGVPLQTLTAEQNQLISTYNAPPYFNSAGSIPFIDIGNQQLSQGANYSPQVLADHSQQDIANNLSNPNSDITKGIVGTANYLTAAICMATNQQPASVCTAAPIPQIEQTLGKTAFNNSHNQATGLVYGPFDVVTRRQQD
jgi:thiol-disulfide isomerase/thioredoxin